MALYGADVFIEFLVKKQKTAKDNAIIIGSIVLVIILNFYIITLLTPLIGLSVPFFLLVGLIYGAYYLICSRNIEYEYAFTNGDFTIDKISNRKTRKRIASFDCSKVETMGKYAVDAEKLKNRRVDKTVMACRRDDDPEAIYVIAQTKKNGLTLIVFSPSEKLLDGMKMFIPRILRSEFYGR